MLKLLLILILLFYLVYRVGAFLLKMLFIGASQQQRQHYRSREYTQTQQKRPTGGNVHIDYVPENKRGKSGKDGFEGGQYVDFEEVKD